MQLHVHVKGISRASRLRAFVANKLNVALARSSHAVQDVTIRMHDINGPDRGGVDKLCRVVLRLKGDSVLVVEDLGANMMEVIDRVADRLRHTVSKQLSRLVKVDRAGIRHHSQVAATA